jgi:hypothetical protein
VSGDIGVKGALNAIESSAEKALGSWGKADGIPSQLYQWGERHNLHPLSGGDIHGLRKQQSFDTLKKRMGAIWWPPVTSSKEIPIIVGLTRKDDDELSIRIGLFRWIGNKPQAIGMRFEARHQDSEVHDFHHAQLWTHIRKGDEGSRIVDPQAWVPQEQPSFPLQAKNALELLWAASVSIYGKRDAATPFEGDDIEKGKIAKYVRELQ